MRQFKSSISILKQKWFYYKVNYFFTSSTFSKDETCCKFTLKNHIKDFAFREIQQTWPWYCVTMFDLNSYMSAPNMKFLQIKYLKIL